MRNYQKPKCVVIEFDYDEDVVMKSGSFNSQSDETDTFTTWTDLFGGGNS